MKINLFLLIIISFLFVSCAKKEGKTSSKIKILSGSLASFHQANNGLLLFGKSIDGKSFTTRVNTDSIDMDFPNGTWNFYAIAWEAGTPSSIPDFTGKTYCGKVLAQNLTGSDTTLNITLTNASCNDGIFSNYVTSISGEYVFPKPNFISCKNLNPAITSGGNLSSCDQVDTAKFNKGYYSSYKVVAYDYKNFGPNQVPPTVKVFKSKCIKIEQSMTSNQIAPVSLPDLNSLRVPVSVGNGLAVGVEAYYSGDPSGCNNSLGFDRYPISGNGRSFTTTTSSAGYPDTYQMFFQTTDSDVCSFPRDSIINEFAAGAGTVGLPYAICNEGQFDLLAQNYNINKSYSFDLLTNLNFGFGSIVPIGDALSIAGGATATNAYTGTFDGHNHSISNFMLNCTLPSGTAPNHSVGLFRKAASATFRNLTINNGIVLCDGAAFVGTLVGEYSGSGGYLENVFVHGHGEGGQSVGGVVGGFFGTSLNVTNVHVKGDYKGTDTIGGIFGHFNATASSNLSKLSFMGGVSARTSSTPTNSYVGGLFGILDTSSGTTYLNESIVKAERIEGSMAIGGLVGEAWNLNISNSYVESLISSQANTTASGNVSVGGAVGDANNVNLTQVFSLNSNARYNTLGTNDHTLGGLIGNVTTSTCSSSYYTGPHDGSNTACGSSITNAGSRQFVTYSMMVNKIKKYMGTWDAAATQSFPNTCTTPDDGKYWIVTSARANAIISSTQAVNVNDIVICLSSSKHYVSAPDVINYLDTNFKWTMSDDGYDIPRLSFEEGIENKVDYLKRPCHDHYTSQYGTGTITNPKWICNYNQFAAMNATDNYILMKNIFNDDTTPSATHTPLTAGAYKLNGNSFGLYNFKISVPPTITGSTNYGIFQMITETGEIKNLKIFNSIIHNSTSTTTSGVTPQYIKMGVLAGGNAGTIENVNVMMSKIELNNPILVASNSLYLGGAVGYNAGTIKKSHFDIENSLSEGSFPVSSELIAGSVVGVNQGTITSSKSYSSFSRNFNCTTGGVSKNISLQETLSGFVGKNISVSSSPGLISEVQSDGELRVQSFQNVCPIVDNGFVSPFVAKNEGTISDFLVGPRIWYNNSSTPAPAPEIFATNIGTVSRGFVTFESPAIANKILPQSSLQTNKGSWDTTTYSSSSNPSIAPQATCLNAMAGEYFTATALSAGTNVGPISAGDLVMCDGSCNVIIPQRKISSITTAMTEVLYLVKTPPPTLPPLMKGRYYDENLNFDFSSSNSGLRVVDSVDGQLINNTNWIVNDDFLHRLPTDVWGFDELPTTKPPKLIKTDGGLDELPPIFPI